MPRFTTEELKTSLQQVADETGRKLLDVITDAQAGAAAIKDEETLEQLIAIKRRLLFPREIHVTMTDENGKTVERDIDISNFAVEGVAEQTEENADRQHAILVDWIAERGNQQHNAELSLVSWYIH